MSEQWEKHKRSFFFRATASPMPEGMTDGEWLAWCHSLKNEDLPLPDVRTEVLEYLQTRCPMRGLYA